MKKTLMCATAAAAFASAGLVAHAQDGWYSRADLSYGFAGKLDHDPVASVNNKLAGDSDISENIGGGLGLGYGFASGLRLEAVVSMRDGDLDVTPLVSGVSTGSLNPNGHVNASDLFLNAIYDFNPDGNFQPYFGVGVGGMRVKAKASNRSTIVGTATNARNGFADQTTGIGYQGLAGFGFKLSDRTMFDLGYRYVTAQDLDFKGNHGGVNYTGDYTEHAATLGFRVAFGAAPVAPPPVVEEPPAPVAEVVPTPVEPPPAPPPTIATPAPVFQCGSLNQSFVVYFEWDKADLTSQASAVIDQAVANIAAQSGCAASGVSIVGHTDSSGGNAYNDRLSARRADVVANALIAKGISGTSISKSSRGEGAQAKSTRDGVREPLNRRSEVTITVN